MVHIRNRYLCLLDMLLIVMAYCFVIILVAPIANFQNIMLVGVYEIIGVAIIYAVFFMMFAVYRTDWVRAAPKDYLRLVIACAYSAFASLLFSRLTFCSYSLKLNIAINFTACSFLCGLRFAMRMGQKIFVSSTNKKGKKILIIGAGRLAVMLMRDILENNNFNYEVVGLIDDDGTKQFNRIYGSKVIGGRDDIISICETKDVDEIIFAIYNIDSKQKTLILDICSKTGKKVKILPGVEESLLGTNQLQNVREINIEDLLERDPIKLDNQLIKNDIADKTVLVTGGGGSIGSELCRQIIKYKPERLIILDIYENTTYELQNELEEKYPEQKIDVLIASVRDKKRLDVIFDTYRPDVVFHAAAHKHVPLMEYSPCEAIKNNVFGTYNTAICATEYNVKRFVMISTDKAVNPTNIMAASKRMCEMIVQTLQKLGKTEFVAVRFGNVLNSHGSVVPRFKKQIENGGPVTVTHPEIVRFFMTIPEAALLVLQAAAYARGGEIFVLDMGEQVKIYDLARKMIRLSGYVPDKDIKIEFTGLRPGEKLYEELLMNEEGLKKTAHSKIFVGQPIDMTVLELEEKLAILKDAMLEESTDMKEVMKSVVPTYLCEKQDVLVG